jgi:hypothetical protein
MSAAVVQSLGDASKVQTNIGLDGKPTNIRMRQNVFEEENYISEKEKLRERMLSDADGMKAYIKTMTPTDIFILFDEDDSGLISYLEFRKMWVSSHSSC